jgi:hypothetical protein
MTRGQKMFGCVSLLGFTLKKQKTCFPHNDISGWGVPYNLNDVIMKPTRADKRKNYVQSRTIISHEYKFHGQ